jgi:lipid-A-disaccharide synthase
MRFALVAGEASGDILGAALIQALRQRYPQATFYGVAGPRMQAAGCEVLESIDALSVMGLTEVVRHLPRLFRLRSALAGRLLRDRPDAVIGIDAPDFNLGLERRLKAHGLRTVHVVSPTVWAWRPGRIHGIARAVDLMLCLYPFETALYRDHAVRAAYIGHPLADELDDGIAPGPAREALQISGAGPLVAVLPGSRRGELDHLAEPFVQAVAWLAQRMPELHCVTPLAGPELRPLLEQSIARHAPGVPWRLLDGHSRQAMQAADAVLLASGTASLEGLLLGRPMVVGYRTGALTAFLLRTLGLLKIRHVSLPNLLCHEPVVPELLQDDARPEWLGQELWCLLRHRILRERQLEAFDAVRTELRRGAAQRGAQAIAELLAR